MNAETEFVETSLQNEPADGADPRIAECQVRPTLVELVATAQTGWRRFREAQLHVLVAGAQLLHFAEAHERIFREFCGCVLGELSSSRRLIDPARASLETLAFALQVSSDPDALNLTRAQRAEYASGLGWFAHLCPEADPDKAVALAHCLGRLTGIAALYRQHKDEKDPSRQRRVTSARKTRTGHAAGNNGTSTTPEGLAALPVDEPPATPADMALSAKNETISASIAPSSAASQCPADASGQPNAGVDPAEKVELPFAVRTAAQLARTAVYCPELAQLLVDHLWTSEGIRPALNLASLGPDQKVLVWLQVNGLFFGPIRDASSCSTIAAQVAIEHVPHQRRRAEYGWQL